MLRTTTLISALLALGLSGCGGINEKLSRINEPPAQTRSNAMAMPMPEPVPDVRAANSLWSTNRTTFFKDQRARAVGDILTVLVEIADKAELENETKNSRTAATGAGVDNFLGYESYAGKVFPGPFDPENLIGVNSTSSQNGKGEVDREEKINVKLAAVVQQILPNGNMVVKGSQEVRVNFENRVLTLAGVIRPEDITLDNTIGYEKVAEARISYGGRGQQTDLQQAPYGHQFWDAVSPF